MSQMLMNCLSTLCNGVSQPVSCGGVLLGPGKWMSCSLRECHWSLDSSGLKPWIRGFRVSFLCSLGLKHNIWEQQLWHLSVQVHWNAKFFPKDKIITFSAGEQHWHNTTPSNSEVTAHVITSPSLSFWNSLALGFLLLSRKTKYKEQSGSSPSPGTQDRSADRIPTGSWSLANKEVAEVSPRACFDL